MTGATRCAAGRSRSGTRAATSPSSTTSSTSHVGWPSPSSPVARACGRSPRRVADRTGGRRGSPGAAGGARRVSSASSARRPSTRQRIGLSPLGFLELSPPSFVELAGQAGFDAVALRLRSAAPGGLAHPLRVGDAPSRATLDAVRATGVTVEHVEVFSLGEDDVAQDRPLLEAAAALGARRVLATGDDLDSSLVADRLAALCELARELGLVVDLEFMPFRPVSTLAAAIAVATPRGRTAGRGARARRRAPPRALRRRARRPGRCAAHAASASVTSATRPLPRPPPGRWSTRPAAVGCSRARARCRSRRSFERSHRTRLRVGGSARACHAPRCPRLERARLVRAATARLLGDRGGTRPLGGVV